MSRVISKDGKARDVLPFTMVYFPYEVDALNCLKRHYSSIYEGRTPFEFDGSGHLCYKEKRTVGVLRTHKEEMVAADDAISIQRFYDKNEVMLRIEVIDTYHGKISVENFNLALAIEKEMAKQSQ